jgi:ADP-ribose pyrophosphatase YjhB (NUDIX family)
MNRRLAVRGIIVKDGKLLCFRLKPYRNRITGEYWCIPGGGVDIGEALLPALERELIEETGITPVIGRLLYIQQYKPHDQDREDLEFFFHITNANDYANIDLSKTSHGEAEVEEFAFIEPGKHTVKPTFLKEVSSNDLSTPAAVQFFSYL